MCFRIKKKSNDTNGGKAAIEFAAPIDLGVEATAERAGVFPLATLRSEEAFERGAAQDGRFHFSPVYQFFVFVTPAVSHKTRSSCLFDLPDCREDGLYLELCHTGLTNAGWFGDQESVARIDRDDGASKGKIKETLATLGPVYTHTGVSSVDPGRWINGRQKPDV